MKSERGFVLIEFIIALPLIILLLYGLGAATMKIFSTAKFHVADYVLEVETQDALARITSDLRAASSVERKLNGKDIHTLIVKYHGASTFYYETKNNRVSNDTKIFDIIDVRVYAVGGNYKLNAKRQNDGSYLNPINGGNFFGDTVVTRLKYTKLDEKVLHVELEMESLVTGRSFKVATAVFMPACESMSGF